MEVLKKGIRSYPQDPTRFFEFSRFNQICGEFVLIEGFIDFQELIKIRDKKIVYLEFDEPNRFFISEPLYNHIKYEGFFDKVFTICPYTAEWLNNKHHNNKRTAVFFPFNESYIPKSNEKIYDVIYTGHIVSKKILDVINVISKYNYRFVSNSDHKLVTNKGASYLEKLNLISKSKITIVNNLLYLGKDHIKNLHNVEGYEDNDAYRFVPRRSTQFKFIPNFFYKKETIVPQIKSRVFEAAFSRSLILCKKDPFNIIERFFKPNREFIYYEPNRLTETLDEILKNYDSYESIIENAFERASDEYTTKSFFETYLRDLEFEES